MSSPLAILCSLPCLAGLRGDEPESRKPSAQAPQVTTFGWVSEVGLRFAWSLPEGYDGRTPCDLTVVLHGQGSSYLWSPEHHPPASFRARDVLVSPEGTTEQPDGSHVFIGRPADAERFRAFLEELRATFAVQRIFLYGFEDGGAFALFFAGEAPESVAGVVAHGGGFLEWTHAPQAMRQLPIVLLHGTRDSVVPYSASVEARDKLLQRGLRAVRLRRMGGYSHGPNAVRAGEALGWCQGYASQSPAETLDCARELLRVKPPDEFQYETLVDFAGARVLLQRLLGQTKRPFTDVPDELGDEAQRLLKSIDDAADEQVSVLKKHLPRKALELDGKSWLGHLVPLREDFRGFPALEALAKELDYDALSKQHAAAAQRIFGAWREATAPAPAVTAVVETLGHAFLVDGYPDDLASRMDEWLRQSPDLASESALSDFRNWQRGWREGSAEYERLWRRWKTPKGRTAR